MTTQWTKGNHTAFCWNMSLNSLATDLYVELLCSRIWFETNRLCDKVLNYTKIQIKLIDYDFSCLKFYSVSTISSDPRGLNWIKHWIQHNSPELVVTMKNWWVHNHKNHFKSFPEYQTLPYQRISRMNEYSVWCNKFEWIVVYTHCISRIPLFWTNRVKEKNKL